MSPHPSTLRSEARELLRLAWPIMLTQLSMMSLGVVDLYKENEDIKDEDLTAEYICDNIWIVGSPDTVTRKLRKLYDDTGGFGTVLQVQYVYEPFDAWLENMNLFAKEVMPNLADLVPEDAVANAAQ